MMRLHWRDNRGLGLPCRVVIGFFMFSAIMLQYTLKVSPSVAIVAMVKSVNKNVTNASWTDDSCNAVNDDIGTNNTHVEGEFEWDEEVQGHVLSSYFYGYLSSQLLGGYMAERLGGRFVCGLGVFLSGILTLLAPIAARTHVYLLIAVRALTGLTSGVVLPSIHALIARWYPPSEQSTFTTAIISGVSVGIPLGMSVSGILVQTYGWPSAFYFFGSLAVLWFLPWLYYVHSTPSSHPRLGPREKEHIISQMSSDALQGQVKLPVPWLSIFTSVPIWVYFIYNTGLAWFLYTMMTELPTYLKTILHFDVQQSGLISALPYLCSWIFTAVSGWLSQKLRDTGIFSHLTFIKIFNGICNLGIAACLASIPSVGCNTVAILVLLVVSVTLKCFAFSGSYFSNLVLAPNFAGTIAGVSCTLDNILGAVAPLVVGTLTKGHQKREQWAKVFYISSGVMCFTFLVYLVFGSMDEQPWNNQHKSSDCGKLEAGNRNSGKKTVSDRIDTQTECISKY